MQLFSSVVFQIPPLKVKRAWHKESSAGVKESSRETREAVKEGVVSSKNEDEGMNVERKPHRAQRPHKAPPPSHITTPYSEFESRRGRHSDPLYSIHDSTHRKSGIDPMDADVVHVDPHVLATPLITDVDGDGVHAEMVVPVSYYFDSRYYGNPSNLAQLNGLAAGELVNYVGGGVVVIGLKSGKIIGQKLLGMTRATDNQPNYILATPTVIRIASGQSPVIALGTAKGELHVLLADTLEEKSGFPVLLDSITAQVAVEDVFDGGHLDLLVGDYSGNVYCVDGNGVRVWERELGKSISTALRIVDIDRDGESEVVVTSREGDVWVLETRSGKDWSPNVFPIHLGARTENPAVLLRTRNLGRASGNETVAIVIGTSSGLYMVDAQDGCVHHVPVASSHVIHEVLTGDVDPYRPGLELLSVGLDGTIVCYAVDVSNLGIHTESWSMEPTGPIFFAHKSSSFFFTMNTTREVSGKTFEAELVLYTNRFKTGSRYNVSVSIGTHTELYWSEVTAARRRTSHPLQLPTPDRPLSAIVTVRTCNSHQQCRSKYVNVRFNLHFEDHLRWFLCLPFLSFCAVVLWVHRKDSNSLSLPTSSHSALSAGTRKDL